jgi:hypothetical protein
MKKERGNENMNIRKIGVVLLALLLAGMAMVPMVSAQSVDTSSVQKSDKYMEWAYTMEGKEVPVSLILEKRNPEYWANLTKEDKRAFSNIKTKIPDYHTFDKPSDKQSVSATASGSPEGSDKSAGSLSAIIYTADATGFTGAIPFGINFWASTTTNYPCPYSLVIADLMRWDGSKWVRADEATATGYYTTFTEAWKNKFFPQSGYYRTYSQHFGNFPPGAIPPTWTLAWWSNTVYYS